MNMVVERSILTRDILQKTHDTFGEVIKIYDTKIPRTLQIGRAKLEQKSIFEYAPKSKAAIAFENFGKEFLAIGACLNECEKCSIT